MKYQNSFNNGIVLKRGGRIIFGCGSCKYADSPKVIIQTKNNVADVSFNGRHTHSFLFDDIDFVRD